MGKIIDKHKILWVQKRFLLNVLLGLFLLFLGLFVTYYANSYTLIKAGNSVTDIILDNLPVVDVDFLYSEGALLFLIVSGIILLIEPRRIPFTLKSIAIFFLVRSLFMVLTHIGPPPNALSIQGQDIFHKLSSGDDLFFSAHTGLPILMTLIFWDEKYLRYFFFASAIVGGAVVLLGHLHYSIDVFSAAFITYGIYRISKFLFRRDFALTKGTEIPI